MIEFMKFIKRSDVKKNHDKFFVFGDNNMHLGIGGQAKEMRGEPNAIGVRTKKTPGIDPSAYYTDNEFDDNKQKIDLDLNYIEMLLSEENTVVFPKDGIGTGLAKLQEKAPKTFEYLQNRLKEIFETYGGNNLY